MSETWDEKIGRLEALIRGDRGDLSEWDCVAVRAVLDSSVRSGTAGDLARVLAEVLDWFAPESWGEAYDRWAAEFHRETGRWCPGKSAPLEMHTDHERDSKAWNEWNEKRRYALVAGARAALTKARGETP